MHVDRERAEPLSNVDSAWLRMEEPTNLMTITGLITFEDRLRFERVKSLLEDRLLSYDRFRQKVVTPRNPLAKPAWVEDSRLALKAHLHRIALREPGDQGTLQELVSDLMSTPLDRGRPLWQLHVIDNYDGGSAIVMRLHHCIGDGMALVRVMFGLTDAVRDPHPATPHHGRTGRRRRRRPVAQLLGDGFDTLLDPQRVMELARSGASAAAVLRKLLALPRDPHTVFHGRLGLTKKAAWSGPVDLERVKVLGRRAGATVNDVLLAALTGALRSYLLRRGDEVEGRELKAVVPVNLRGPDEMEELGNRFGLVFVPLPVGLATPEERLAEVKVQMDEIKSSPQAGVAFGVLGVLGRASPEIQSFGVGLFGSKATLVMTNVPGPRERLFMAGSRIRDIMFWVPQSARLGLGVSIFSYAGQVRVGIAVDAALVPDPETIAGDFEVQIELLAEAAGGLRAAAASP